MKNTLIIGSQTRANSLIKQIKVKKLLNIVGMFDLTEPIDHLKEWLRTDIDIIVVLTNEREIFQMLKQYKQPRSIIITEDMLTGFVGETNLSEDIDEPVTSLYESIFNQLPASIISMNALGTVQYVNQDAVQLFNDVTLKVGVDIEDILPELNIKELLKANSISGSAQQIYRNGIRLIVLRLPLRDDDNRLIGITLFCQNFKSVVSFVEKHIEIEDLHKVFNNMVGNSLDGYLITDMHNSCRYINEMYAKWFDIEASSIQHTKDFIGASLHQKVLETRRTLKNEQIEMKRSKQKLDVTITPLIINGKLKGTIGVYSAATMNQNITAELEDSQQLVRFLEKNYILKDIQYQSREMQLVLEQAKVAAGTRMPVLIRGEYGTGKKMLAQAIHNESTLRFYKCTTLNCLEMSNEEIDSLLISYRKQVSQISKRKGIQGTIVIENIELLQPLQQKILLEILKTYSGIKDEDLNTRIIVLSSANLEHAIMENIFNEELYYVINKMPICLPNLQERAKDIPILAKSIIRRLNFKLAMNVKSIQDDALNMLMAMEWKQNMFSLENAIEKMMLNGPRSMNFVTRKDVVALNECSNKKEDNVATLTSFSLEGQSLQASVEQFEKEFIAKTYEMCHFNKTKTAETLRISIRNLYYKLNKYDL